MGFLPSPISFLLTFLSSIVILISTIHLHVVADDDPGQHYYDIMERDALYSLKAEFNNSFLNNNWNGVQQCSENSSSWFGVQCLNNRVKSISLEGIGLTGKVRANAFSNLTELSSLSFKNNWISGYIMDFSSNIKLVHVDLSGNMFEGTISHSLLGLQALQSLHLQDNNLMGPIPGFSQKSLKEFNVSNNNLSGKVPKTRALQSFNISSYMGNPGLCGSPTPITCLGARIVSDVSKDNAEPFKGKTITIVFVVLIVIAVVGSVMFFTQCYNKDKKLKVTKRKGGSITKNNEKVQRGENREDRREDGRNLVFINGRYEFEIGDLLKASAEMLGQGNFGNAYKVMLADGPDVVVKRLKDLRPLSREEFIKKTRGLAELKHPNLLPPLAYYYSEDEKLLVYKYAEKGNLYDLIHGGRRAQNRVALRWSTRIGVAKGVARAMEFLHANIKSVNAIPHGNLKSSNVLLDENGMVLVSDYGLLSLITLPIATQRLASFRSPEYQNLKKISKKADVWNYGSLLLELLTGRLSANSVPRGTNGVDLCSWVHRAVREEWTAEIFDPEISQVCMKRSAAIGLMKLLQLALWCCDKAPEKRPDMSQVLREVESIKLSGLEDDEGSSFDRSLTEDSISTNGSGIIGEEK